MDRRNFLKAAAITAAALGLPNAVGGAATAFKEDEQFPARLGEFRYENGNFEAKLTVKDDRPIMVPVTRGKLVYVEDQFLGVAVTDSNEKGEVWVCVRGSAVTDFIQDTPSWRYDEKKVKV